MKKIILWTVPRRCFFWGSFLLFMFHVCLCCTVLSVPYSLVITCWERADLLALLFVMFPCVFVTFPYGVSTWVGYLIVSLPNLCLLLYFFSMMPNNNRTLLVVIQHLINLFDQQPLLCLVSAFHKKSISVRVT